MTVLVEIGFPQKKKKNSENCYFCQFGHFHNMEIVAKMWRKKGTVLKIQDFSVIQILREINFDGFRSSKTAVLAILKALNFVDLVNISL